MDSSRPDSRLSGLQREILAAFFAHESRAERTVVDLVVDRAPQLETEKRSVGNVRIDSLLEIAANKLCALLSRNEPKDLVDLKAILETGVRLEDALRGAERKDGGASAANVAFVLDQWRIAAAAKLPGDADAVAVEAFRVTLVDRLCCLAFPGRPDRSAK